jgi:hypothetical protein
VARALASVLGSERRGEAPWMLVRLRIDNESAAPVEVLADEMLLLGSDLQEFGAPAVDPPTEPIPSGESRTYSIAFPFPSGMSLAAGELGGVSFRWSLRHGSERAEITTSFERVRAERVYWHPYPYSPYYPHSGFSLSVGGVVR